MLEIKVGKKLENIRLDLNLSRSHFEREYNISASTIRFWEAGNIDRESQKLKQYIEIYNTIGLSITEEWLFDGFFAAPHCIQNNLLAVSMISNNLSLSSVIQILSKTSSFIYFINQNQEVLYINDKTKFFTDLKLNLNVKVSLSDLHPEISTENLIRYYNEAINGKEVKFKCPLVNNEFNNSGYYSIMYTAMRDKTDSVIGVLAFISQN